MECHFIPFVGSCAWRCFPCRAIYMSSLDLVTVRFVWCSCDVLLSGKWTVSRVLNLYFLYMVCEFDWTRLVVEDITEERVMSSQYYITVNQVAVNDTVPRLYTALTLSICLQIGFMWCAWVVKIRLTATCLSLEPVSWLVSNFFSLLSLHIYWGH